MEAQRVHKILQKYWLSLHPNYKTWKKSQFLIKEVIPVLKEYESNSLIFAPISEFATVQICPKSCLKKCASKY